MPIFVAYSMELASNEDTVFVGCSLFKPSVTEFWIGASLGLTWKDSVSLPTTVY